MSNACLTLCLINVLNVKALLDAFNQENALEGTFFVNVKFEIFANLHLKLYAPPRSGPYSATWLRLHGHGQPKQNAVCHQSGVTQQRAGAGHAGTGATSRHHPCQPGEVERGSV